MALVKPNISERDGVDLDYGPEEVNPHSDILRSAGIQIHDADQIRVIPISNPPREEAGRGSLGLRSRELYLKDRNPDTGWFLVQTHPQYRIDRKIRVPHHGQYVLHGRPLIIQSGGALWLQAGAELLFRA